MKIMVWAWLRAFDRYIPCAYEFEDINKTYWGTREYEVDDIRAIMFFKIIYDLIYYNGDMCNTHPRVFAGKNSKVLE